MAEVNSCQVEVANPCLNRDCPTGKCGTWGNTRTILRLHLTVYIPGKLPSAIYGPTPSCSRGSIPIGRRDLLRGDTGFNSDPNIVRKS